MSGCPGFLPHFQKQLDPNDPNGPKSCTCYSGAMAGEYDTCGRKTPSGALVRIYTDDFYGGTTLMQVDSALRKGWDIDLDTRIGSAAVSWATFERYIDSGRGAILQGDYRAFHGTHFDAGGSFGAGSAIAGHAIFVPPGWGAMDPLADGRRPGIYRYHGEVYPRTLLLEFAASLVLDTKTGRKLGTGHAWASFTRDNEPAYRWVLPLLGDDPTRGMWRYWIDSEGRITKRTRNTTAVGVKASCTAPRRYLVKPGTALYKKVHSKGLVKLTEGHRNGWYVSAVFAEEV